MNKCNCAINPHHHNREAKIDLDVCYWRKRATEAQARIKELETPDMFWHRDYPWIKWSGGQCPVPPEMVVKVKFRNGVFESGLLAGSCYWFHDGGDDDIVEYRPLTEEPDLEAAEELLSANGYTVIPPAKPITFEDVTPLTEAPPKGTWYWVLQPFWRRGVEALNWDGDEADLAVLRHRMAYLDKEHALIAARHIFGLKGGEL